MDFDWKKLVGTVAPTLATVLGGPLAGLGVTALTEAFGISADLSPAEKEKQIATTLQSTSPETLLKLKEIEANVTLTLEKIGLDKEKLVFDDRANARARNVDLKDRTPAYLAYILTGGFFFALGGLYFISIPLNNRDVVNIMIGTLGTCWLGAMAFFHGSSVGSRLKDSYNYVTEKVKNGISTLSKWQ